MNYIKDMRKITFDKESLIDYSVNVDGKIIGWIHKIYYNGKNSGRYYFEVKIDSLKLENALFFWEGAASLSGAKEKAKEYLKGKI